MKYEVDINDLSKSELYDLLVVRDNKIERLHNIIKEVREYIGSNDFLYDRQWEKEEKISNILDKE